MARRGLVAPVNVTWEITLKCNLRCVHCLSAAGSEMSDELTRAECLFLMDQLASMKVFQINIGGGEPFMRADFPDLLTHCHKKGMVTCVSTNGLRIDDETANYLSGLDMLYLQVSLDGATEEVNDRIRGRGTYKRVMSALESLARHKVQFSINTVLHRYNYPQLEDLRALAREYGAELRVSRFRPSGRGMESRAWMAPDSQQLEAFAKWLELNDLVRTGDSFFCLTSEKRRRQGLDMCGAAKMTCCISPRGDVFPCAFLQEPLFRAGNVRMDTFRKIWDGSPIMNKLRFLNIKSCETCSRFESCRGGCPAMAFHTHQDITLPDPECLVNLHRDVPEAA